MIRGLAKGASAFGDSRYVPILSGGLLGISKRWWNETGGGYRALLG